MNKIIFSAGEIKGNETLSRAALLLLHQTPPKPPADKTVVYGSSGTLTTRMLQTIGSDF